MAGAAGGATPRRGTHAFPLFLAFGFAAFACAPEVAEDSSDPSSAGEDSGTAGPPASVTLNDDTGATGLGNALVRPCWIDSSAAPTGVWLAMRAAGSPQTTDLPAPPSSEGGSVAMFGGGRGAVYFLTVHADVDGSGTPAPGEAWVSVATFAVYLEGAPEPAVAAGFTPGWNRVGYPASTPHPLGDVPVTLLRPTYEVRFGLRQPS